MLALDFLSLDSLFHSVKTDKIILNEYDINTSEELEELKTKLNTIYESDTISLLPKCDCGIMEGEFFRGLICSTCNTKVKSIYEDHDPFIWFRALEGYKFISPEFWVMFKKTLGGNIDFLRWISDTQYNPPVNSLTSKRILSIIKNINGFERSYTWLVKNMRQLLVTLSVVLKKDRIRSLLELYIKNKKHILSNYLPLQNKRMFILENTAKNKYTNLKILDVIDTVLYFIKNSTSDKENKREQVMSRTCAELGMIYEDSIATFLSSKGGIPRKHINGFRSYFTSRAVIVPVVGSNYKYDTIEIPWSIIIVTMRPHFLNKLLKRGYSYIVANKMLYRGVEHFDPVLNEIIDELLVESPHDGFPMTINRNPSLLNGSTQTVMGFPKRDPEDKTIGLPILISGNPNA